VSLSEKLFSGERMRGEDIDPTHLYLVKNLRGIIYFSSGINVEAELDWLKRKFRYRDLGISENLGIKRGWKRLVILPRIEEDPTLDSLLQASKYICPLLILKGESLRDFKELIIAELKTKENLGDRELKFNLRLINYSITDFYLKSLELAKEKDMEGRRNLAHKDLKRFWRIKESGEGRTLIAYMDPLLKGREIKNPTLLSIIPAIVIDF
jgi:hypothetical protein